MYVLLSRFQRIRVFFIGDSIFAIRALGLGWFISGLKTGWSLTSEKFPDLEEAKSKA
jgi:nitric oxide reductase subunit B